MPDDSALNEPVPDPHKALERARELARRLIAVPKTEIADKPKPKKRKHV